MWGGRTKTIERFYAAERQALYTYALSLTGDRERAEDIIHSVVTRLLSGGRLPNELRPYVFRMIRNAAIDEARRMQRKPDEATLLAQRNGQGGDPVQYARYREIESALEALSDDERETVVLKNLTGLTFQEIADVKNVSINTAASWHRRGLQKLRTILGADE